MLEFAGVNKLYRSCGKYRIESRRRVLPDIQHKEGRMTGLATFYGGTDF